MSGLGWWGGPARDDWGTPTGQLVGIDQAADTVETQLPRYAVERGCSSLALWALVAIELARLIWEAFRV